MNLEKVAEIRQRFPFIDDKCKFNFGDGWAKIVMGFCGTVRFLAVDGFRITQLELRYGQLNIEYVNEGRGNSALDKLVAQAEIRSKNTCECGDHQLQTESAPEVHVWWIRGQERRLCQDCQDRYWGLYNEGREKMFQV